MVVCYEKYPETLRGQDLPTQFKRTSLQHSPMSSQKFNHEKRGVFSYGLRESFLKETHFLLVLVEFDQVQTLFLSRLKGMAQKEVHIGLPVRPRFSTTPTFKVTDVWFEPRPFPMESCIWVWKSTGRNHNIFEENGGPKHDYSGVGCRAGHHTRGRSLNRVSRRNASLHAACPPRLSRNVGTSAGPRWPASVVRIYYGPQIPQTRLMACLSRMRTTSGTLSGHASGLCRGLYSSAKRKIIQQSHLRRNRRHPLHDLPEETPGRNQANHAVIKGVNPLSGRPYHFIFLNVLKGICSVLLLLDESEFLHRPGPPMKIPQGITSLNGLRSRKWLGFVSIGLQNVISRALIEQCRYCDVRPEGFSRLVLQHQNRQR